MSYLHDLHIATIHIETDCTDLVEMIGNPIDCLGFPSELVSCRPIGDVFSGFSIYYIPRSRNMRDDFRSKEERNSGDFFFSCRSDPIGAYTYSDR